MMPVYLKMAMPAVTTWLALLALLVFLAGCKDRSASEADGLQERAAAQPVEAPASDPGEEFRRVMEFAAEENLHGRPIGQIIVALAERFLGKPYAAGILDEPVQEELVVSFAEFDCVTYVETMLALAQGIAAENYSYDDFLERLKGLRYRGGEMGGYCSRLHYFSEWIADNERRGHVRNVTQELGGVELEKRLNFS